MSNNRIYYGEYSLAYWIQMILKGNIVLPEYQRTFVWNKDDYTRGCRLILRIQYL